MVLDQIQNVNDIKNLTEEEIDTLREEIRTFLIESIAKTGGHLASNLGVIELTMALHLSFDLTKDKIVWDVGHQSYTHKILTGRKDGFEHLREYADSQRLRNVRRTVSIRDIVPPRFQQDWEWRKPGRLREIIIPSCR